MSCVCFSVCSTTWSHLPRAGPAIQKGQGSDHREGTDRHLVLLWGSGGSSSGEWGNHLEALINYQVTFTS